MKQIQKNGKGSLFHNKLVFSILTNAGFLLMLYLCMGFQYELSDDWFFSANIAKGNYNFTFCSYFIQVISGFLQKAVYPLNAFMLIQLVFGFVALTTISYILFDIHGIKRGIFFVLFLESAFAFNVYSLITFSKTAAVLCVAGCLVIFWAHCEKKKIGHYVYGMLLVLLGSFYRFQIFYSVFVIFGCFVAGYLFHRTDGFQWKKLWNQIREFFCLRMVLVLGILIVLVFSFNSISRMILYGSGELDYYREYNSLRSSVVDFQLPDFQESPEQYEALDISQNDIELLRGWYLDDQGMGTTDTLREISKMQEGRQTEKAYLINMAASFAGLAELMLVMIYLFTILMIWRLCQKKSWWFILTILAGMLALYGYLFMIGRSNYRSVFSIWFTAVVCLMYAARFLGRKEEPREGQKNRNRFRVCACAIISVIFFVTGVYVAAPSISRKAEKPFPGLEQYIEESEGKVFALGRASYLLFRNMTQFDNAMIFSENQAFEKCVYFGTPYYAHPSYNQLLEGFGIENLYTALAEKDNLYFVDNFFFPDIDKMVTYLNEQYGGEKKYESKLIHEVEEFSIYKITEAK